VDESPQCPSESAKRETSWLTSLDAVSFSGILGIMKGLIETANTIDVRVVTVAPYFVSECLSLQLMWLQSPSRLRCIG
jgi:hypothetical protein